MKKLTSILALFLVAMLVFASCAQGAGLSSSPESTSTDSSEPLDPEAKYPEPITVRVAYATNAATTEAQMDGNTYEDNPWTRLLLEKYNIKVEVMWEALSGDQYKTKLDLAIASGQIPDIIRTSDYSQFISLAEGGCLAGLDDYYDNYLSEINKVYMMQDGGKSLAYGRYNDELLGISASPVDYAGARIIYIREDWMKELGLDAPKTIEDVIAIGKKFADAGEGRYALPLFKNLTNDNMCDIVGMANAFGATPRMWKAAQDGSAVYGSIQPEMKNVLQAYADLYREGYIDPAFASLDGGKVGEQLTSDKIGVIIGGFWLPAWPLTSNFELNGTNWISYPILPSETLEGDMKVQVRPVTGSMICVNKDFEHPEVLFKVLNAMTEKLDDPDEQATYHSYALEDGTSVNVFDMTPFGYYLGDRMINFNTYTNCKAALETGDEMKLVSAHDKLQYPKLKAYKEAIEAGVKPTIDQWVIAEFFYGPNSAYASLNHYFDNGNYIVDVLPGYQTPEMVRQWSNLTMLEDQYFVEIISGITDVETGFQEFVDAWKAMGGDTITKEVNDWYMTNK